MRQLSARIVALFCALSSATLAAVEIWPNRQQVVSSNENGDGPSHAWRQYDTQGRLTEIDRDTNFDGHADIEEYYQRGVLIRRESDRDFNGQTDLVEEFDPVTQGRTRSVADVDYDGIADLLVLFQDGRPVFSKQIRSGGGRSEPWRRNPTVDRQHGGRHLAGFLDPFEADTVVRSVHVAASERRSVGLSTSGGLPRTRFTLLGRLSVSERVVDTQSGRDRLTILLIRASRAPPAS